MRVYLDADILIWVLRGRVEARELMVRLFRDSEDEAWTGAMQRAEILFFMRPDEVETTMALFSVVRTDPVTVEVVDAAAALFRGQSASTGMDMNDAILAATAMLSRGRVVTLNVRHLTIPGLAVERGW